MSLDWNVTEVKNFEDVCWIGDDINPVTQQLIFATMGAGMPHITEQNVAEFYARVTVMQKVHGGGWIMERKSEKDEWASRYITAAEVRAHVGLRTNASPLSRAKFLSSQVTGGMDEMVRVFDKEAAT